MVLSHHLLLDISTYMKNSFNVEIRDGIATITLDKPSALNSMTLKDFDDFSDILRDIDQRQDVTVTIWQATGKLFSAGVDVGEALSGSEGTVRTAFMKRIVGPYINVSQALTTHRKLLVAALNGPAVGIAAAYLGHFDFIYALSSASLSMPFSSLGMVTEAGSSVTFVRRLGVTKANEVLLLGKLLTSKEMLDSGFVNEIFPSQSPASFHESVRAHIMGRLAGLDSNAVTSIKSLIQAGLQEQNNMDMVTMREGYLQAGIVASGVPRRRIARMAKGGRKAKL